MTTPTDEQCKAFVDFSNPHCWLEVAANLHDQAVRLYELRNDSQVIQFNYKTGVSTTRSGTNRTVFLLGGFALENALKCFLVYEKPSLICNGTLSRKLRSHSLTSLQRDSNLIPYKNRLLWVLQSFEDGLESWARYPCALSILDSQEEGLMNERLWSGYLRVMNAYGDRLKTLLSRPWKGPHGFSQQATYEGVFPLSSSAVSVKRGKHK